MATTRGRRAVLTGTVGLGIASLVLPGASAAASTFLTTACETPTFHLVPWIAQGDTATVGTSSTVTVTAVTNGTRGPNIDPPGVYALHEDPGVDVLVLGFSPVVPGVRVTVSSNGDSPNGTETMTITGETAGNVQLFTEAVTDNRTVVHPGSGAFTPGLAKLTIDLAAPGGDASMVSVEILSC